MTMYRYMVLMWPQTDDAATRTADFIAANLHHASPHSWRTVWEAPGITVIDSGEQIGRMQTYRLVDNGGVVLGRLFRNDFTSVTQDLKATTATACIKSKGQYLVDNYWGRYVAFLNDQANSARYILRDPSGAFPCFYTEFENIEIYFSDMQDAADISFLEFNINWEYIKSNLVFPLHKKTHTGLHEVSELQPAECIEISSFKRNTCFLWDPYTISNTDIIEDTEKATATLRETVMQTTAALAGCYNSITHYLGGLDSSILLACLAQASNRPEINTLTYYTRSPLGEERYYSRQVVEKYGIDLTEIELKSNEADLKKILGLNKYATPLSGIECTQLIEDGLELVKQKNSQAIFTGLGGDNVFFQMPENYGALDHVHSYGLLNAQILRVALEASRYGRKSLFTTIRDLLRERYTPTHCYDHVQKNLSKLQNRSIINPEIMAPRDYKKFLHPFLTPNKYIKKGKYSHIRHCVCVDYDYYFRFDTNYNNELIHPLLSQPVIEACLRMPVWVLTYGGVDRGLARRAFKNDLPDDIVRRYSKSTPLQFYYDIYNSNIEFLKNVLLDGELVNSGIILRNKLETALSHEDPFFLSHPTEIFGYLAQEAWLQSWAARPPVTTRLEIAI